MDMPQPKYNIDDIVVLGSYGDDNHKVHVPEKFGRISKIAIELSKTRSVIQYLILDKYYPEIAIKPLLKPMIDLDVEVSNAD